MNDASQNQVSVLFKGGPLDNLKREFASYMTIGNIEAMVSARVDMRANTTLDRKNYRYRIEGFDTESNSVTAVYHGEWEAK